MIDTTPKASGAVVDESSARSPQPEVEGDAGGRRVACGGNRISYVVTDRTVTAAAICATTTPSQCSRGRGQRSLLGLREREFEEGEHRMATPMRTMAGRRGCPLSLTRVSACCTASSYTGVSACWT